MFLTARAVEELDIELLRDGVHCRNLVCPCAIIDDQTVGVGYVLFVCEEPYPLHECTFNLSKTKDRIKRAIFHQHNDVSNRQLSRS